MESLEGVCVCRGLLRLRCGVYAAAIAELLKELVTRERGQIGGLPCLECRCRIGSRGVLGPRVGGARPMWREHCMAIEGCECPSCTHMIHHCCHTHVALCAVCLPSWCFVCMPAFVCLHRDAGQVYTCA
jgi:hypothetical protein